MNSCRWEYGSIVEFVSSCRTIGFDHVRIFCNDDQPYGLHAALPPDRPVQYRHKAERVAFFDSDGLYPDQSSFGPNGDAELAEGGVLQNHTRREGNLYPFTEILARTAILEDSWLAEKPLCDLMHGNGTYPGRFRCRTVIGRDMARYCGIFPARSHRYLDQPRSERDCPRRAARSVEGEFAGRRDRGIRRSGRKAVRPARRGPCAARPRDASRAPVPAPGSDRDIRADYRRKSRERVRAGGRRRPMLQEA